MKSKNFNLKNAIVKSIVFLTLTWFIVFVLIIPNLNTITFIFWQNGEFTFRAFERLFSSQHAMRALRNTLILAPTLSITVGIVGVSLVLITDYFQIRGAKILRLGYMTTLIYSSIILVSGYRFLYGANGILTNFLAGIFSNFNIGWFEGFGAVLFVMTFAATGTHLIFVRNALRTIDYQTIEAAKNMGASQFTILTKVVLPTLAPSLIAVTVFTFMGGLVALAAPLLVGGSNFQTIIPMILSFSRMQGSRDLAALLAVILGIAVFMLIALLSWLERRGHYLSVSKTKSTLIKQKINNPILNILGHIYAYALFVIYVAPVILIILFSFTNSRAIARSELSFSAFTFDNYIRVFTSVSAYRPVLISVLYSTTAALIAAVLITFVCRIITKHKGKFATFLEYGFTLPWFLPPVLIALGLITTFGEQRWYMFNQVLTATMGIMVLGYVIIRMPFTLRMTRAAFFAVDDSLEEAAKNLGAKPFYTFMKIILPVLIPSITAIFALNFIALIQEFEMSVFLYHPLATPLGVEIRNISEITMGEDNTPMIFVYSVILMVISAFMLYIAYGRNQDYND
jgi:iron(III) transport system permease protein